MAVREYAGAAVAAKTTTSVSATGAASIVIDDATGWPSGAGGSFAVVIDPGKTSEEKMLVTSRSGTTLTVDSDKRGYDGTTAQAHVPGAVIHLCVTATDLRESNAHINDTGADSHLQYMKTSGDRHDLPARHQFGAALGTPGAAADIGTAASAGTGTVPARSDHGHKIGAGAINSAGMFADGVVATAKLADNAVTAAKIAASTVTQAHIAAGLHLHPIGSPLMWIGATPSGFTDIDGGEISRTDNPVLFGLWGTTYGAGNGSTTFNKPNMKGRVPVMIDVAQTEFDAVGKTGGTKTVTLTAAQSGSPAHGHNVTDAGHAHPGSADTGGAGFGRRVPGSGSADIFNPGSNVNVEYKENPPTSNAATGITVNNSTATNASQAHDNLAPYFTVRFIVRLG